MFEIQPENGITNAFLRSKVGKGKTDIVKYPPREIFSNSGPNYPIRNATLPPNGFILKLVVLYDDNFKDKFGDDSVEKLKYFKDYSYWLYYFSRNFYNRQSKYIF